jgi:hypothetical protein
VGCLSSGDDFYSRTEIHPSYVGGPCGVLVTREIKEEGSLDLSDRLREGKGWNRPGLSDLLNGI